MEFAHAQDSTTTIRTPKADGVTLTASDNSADSVGTAPVSIDERLDRGLVRLDSTLLRQLRKAKLMSQQDLANDCWRRNIQLSLTTIKRAETGHAVRFRVARELARCFDVQTSRIVRVENRAVPSNDCQTMK